MVSCCFLLVVYLSVAQGLFGKSKVCFGSLGCFENSEPFTNSLGYLPQSPEEIKISLKLLTRENSVTGEAVHVSNPAAVASTFFNPKNPTKIVIHGFMSDTAMPWVPDLVNVLLLQDKCNIFLVDWKNGAHAFYPRAVANTRVVGAVLVEFLSALIQSHGLLPESVHIIGHSLGSHIAGYVGTQVRGLGRITGLDPAGPLFEDVSTEVRIDPTDAIFVDCIHSDGAPLLDAGFGTMKEWCHIDFYPNGGGQQPGCNNPYKLGLADLLTFNIKDLGPDVACSHHRAISYFTESLTSSSCQFKANPCPSVDDYRDGRCQTCGPAHCPMMGQLTSLRGKFFLSTNAQSPFCKI